MQIGQQSQTTTEKENIPPRSLKETSNISKSLFNNDKSAEAAAASNKTYSLRAGKRSRLGQRHGLQNITLTPCHYKNIYRKVRYLYFYESIFQDKSIHIIFTFVNSTT